MQSNEPGQVRYFSRALFRGLAVLSQFDESTIWLSLSELARRTELDKATTLRIVETLRSMGYLERSSATRQYRPGLRVLSLGRAALAASEFRELARPHLEELAEVTQQTVNMGVLVGSRVLYVERIKRIQLLDINIQVGSTLPAYCTSLGKALLAWLEPSDALDHLSETLEPRGPNTILDLNSLVADLALARQRGWAHQDQEIAAGLRSVAAPIKSPRGKVIAAANLAVSADEVTMTELIETYLPQLLSTVEAISLLADTDT